MRCVIAQEHLALDLSMYRGFLGGEERRGSPDLHPAPGRLAPPARTPEADLAVAAGVNNLRQALVNRLLTRRGELAPLGHPEYGSRLYELIGRPNGPTERNLAKLFVLEALSAEPRVNSRRLLVTAQPDPRDRQTILLDVGVQPVGENAPLRFQVPFSLVGGA